MAMTSTEEFEIVFQLREALIKYAPNEQAKETVMQMWRDMVTDKLKNREAVKLLAGKLHDGLAHGNWPWVHELTVTLKRDKDN